MYGRLLVRANVRPLVRPKGPAPGGPCEAGKERMSWGAHTVRAAAAVVAASVVSQDHELGRDNVD